MYVRIYRDDGYNDHPLRQKWYDMNRRCSEKANGSDRPLYLERGIKVCWEWQTENKDGRKNYIDYILNVLGPKPSKDHSIDRIDNNGNYEPGNIRWATRSEQQLNKRPFGSY